MAGVDCGRFAVMAAHTPGPWFRFDGEVRAKEYGLIVRGYYGKNNGESSANIALISAAPDLLSALIGVLRVADRATDEFDAARAAIKKATRETQ